MTTTRLDIAHILLAVIAGYVALLCLAPLGRLMLAALAPGSKLLDWAQIARPLLAPATRIATLHTLTASLGATLLATILGTALALAIGLTDMRGRSTLSFLALLPMLVPAQISALAWLELAGSAGHADLIFSGSGIILLMGIEQSTIIFLSVRAGLRRLPAELIEAAQGAGASRLRIIANIILPLLRPALIGGAALAFVSSVGNFGIPALLGIPGHYIMLTTLIYQRLSGFGPRVLGDVAVLSMILAAMAGLGLATQARALGRHRSETVTGEGAIFRLKRGRFWLEAAVWSLVLLIAVLPLAALAATSVIRALGVPLSPATLTWSHYADVLATDTTRHAFLNSLIFALSTAVISTGIAVFTAYCLHCRHMPLARLINLVADMPFALPGTVLSIAFILTLLRPLPLIGIELYGTPWIILAAYLARGLAPALRLSLSGMRQLDPALEEAACSAGAGSMIRFATIILPLAAPAAAAGAILIFMSVFSELSVSALLWSSGSETVGVVMFNLFDEGDQPAASAVAVLSVLAILTGAGVLQLMAHHLPRGVLPWRG